MANTFSNSQMVTATTLDHFENNLVLAKLVDRQWEDKFGIEGAKIGDTIDLRRHNNATVSTGNGFQPQNLEDAVRRLTIDTPLHVDYEISNAEMSLSFDRAEERYFKPAGRALANKVDALIAGLYKKVSNFVGTYNTLPSALTDFSSCIARLDQFGVETDDRSMALDPITMNAALIATSTLLNDQSQIGKQYMKGRMKRALDADWYTAQNIRAHTTGAGGGNAICAAGQSGASLAVTGLTANIAGWGKEGDVFTIAGLDAVNPITGEDLGISRQFVLTADVDSDGAGAATLSIDPPITTAGPRKTVSAAPVLGAALTWVTTQGSVVANQPLYFHKNWAALCIAPQAMPGNVHAGAMKSDPDGGGIGIRYTMWWDGDLNTWKIRFDILIGLLAQMPELCLRLGTS